MYTYVLLVPHLGIGFATWLQTLLALNQLRKVKYMLSTDVWALLLLLHASLLRWISSLAVQTSSIVFQVLTAAVSSAHVWVSFVVIVNRGFLLPTWQQKWALVMALVITTMWEIINRMIVLLPH